MIAISLHPNSSLQGYHHGLTFPLYGTINGELFICDDGSSYHKTHFIFQ
jgi:hypothetical protein